MADPLRPNPFRPTQNFAAPEAPRQPRPDHPPKYRKVPVDKQLSTATRHHESVTKNLRDLKTHSITSITTEKSTAHSGHFKSHTGAYDGQQSSRLTSQPAHAPQSLSNNGSRATSGAKDLFEHPSVSNPIYSGYAPRLPLVSSRQDSHSLSGRIESSSRTSLAASGQSNPDDLRTLFQKATISGRELPTRFRPSEPGGFENRVQEMEQGMSQRRAEWKAKQEAVRKELHLAIDKPFKKKLKPFWKKSSATTLTQPSTLSSERYLPENCPGITIRSTHKVAHTPENIASTMELVVEEHIQCATINVGEGLQYLRGALVNAYKQLSWGATSKWKAAQAFNSSQSSLNMLARQYEINNISSLPCVDIPEFKEKVKQCVHKFIEATKAIKSDRGKFVTLTINIFMSTADESRRTQRT